MNRQPAIDDGDEQRSALKTPRRFSRAQDDVIIIAPASRPNQSGRMDNARKFRTIRTKSEQRVRVMGT